MVQSNSSEATRKKWLRWNLWFRMAATKGFRWKRKIILIIIYLILRKSMTFVMHISRLLVVCVWFCYPYIQVIGHFKSRHKMKLSSFILTILIQFLFLVMFNVWDNFLLIILIFISCLLSGLLITINSPTKSKIKEIGRGLLFGSLTSLTFGILFFIYIFLNFPK